MRAFHYRGEVTSQTELVAYKSGHKESFDCISDCRPESENQTTFAADKFESLLYPSAFVTHI